MSAWGCRLIAAQIVGVRSACVSKRRQRKHCRVHEAAACKNFSSDQTDQLTHFDLDWQADKVSSACNGAPIHDA